MFKISDTLFKKICKDFGEVSQGGIASLHYPTARQQSTDIVEAIVQGFRDSLHRRKAMVAVAKASRLAGPRVTQFYTQGVNMGEAAASATCLWMQSEQECDATMWQWERSSDVMRQ